VKRERELTETTTREEEDIIVLLFIIVIGKLCAGVQMHVMLLALLSGIKITELLDMLDQHNI